MVAREADKHSHCGTTRTSFLGSQCVFASGVVVLWVLTGCGRQFETQYANKLVKDQCPKVAMGDSIESVYRDVGQPLFIELNHDRVGDGGWRKERSYKVDLASVQVFSKDTNVAVYLHYSSPAAGARGYMRYEVDVSGGKVINVNAGVLVD
jgi:hypothetical protein